MARRASWPICSSTCRFKIRLRSRAWFCKTIRGAPVAFPLLHLRNGCWGIRAALRLRTLSRNSMRRRKRCLRAAPGTTSSAGEWPFAISAEGRVHGRATVRSSWAVTERRTGLPRFSDAARFQEKWAPVLIHAPPGKRAEIVFFLGEGKSREEARELIGRYRAADLDQVLLEVTRQWDDVLGTVQITTPERSMDILANRWLLYQTLSCRVWARAALYQPSGAYGF